MSDKVYENRIIPELPIEGATKAQESLTGSPQIGSTDFGGGIDGNIIPVQRIIRKTVEISSGRSNSPDIGYTIKIEHKLGVPYEVFARYKPEGSSQWQMFPTVFDADGTVTGNTYIQINYTDELVTEIDFHLDVSGGKYDFELVYLLWN